MLYEVTGHGGNFHPCRSNRRELAAAITSTSDLDLHRENGRRGKFDLLYSENCHTGYEITVFYGTLLQISHLGGRQGGDA
jgi:hypothetical protein